MCGIIGYLGPKGRNVLSIALRMLRRLEYRGYDSAGIAFPYDSSVEVIKTKGSIDALERRVKSARRGKMGLSGIVIGHTRWATHGTPSDANAHPHTDCNGRVAIVHNGIIENHMTLRKELESNGHEFTSSTDSEVIAHLIEEELAKGGEVYRAFLAAVNKLKGSYAVACLIKGEERIFFARNESPLIVGIGAGQTLVASDITAMLEHTRRFVFLEEQWAGWVSPTEAHITDLNGRSVRYAIKSVDMSPEQAEKGGYEHFMLKEIFEQPEAFRATIRGRLEPPYLTLDNVINGDIDFDSIRFVACGTSLHAALIGRYLFENIIGMDCSVEFASEFRYSRLTDSNPLIVAITQSGETADTLAAARIAAKHGLRTVAITNVLGSTITRIVDDVIYTHAGPEIGVAATKTFTNQIGAIMALLLTLGHATGRLSYGDGERLTSLLRSMPRAIERVLGNEEAIKTQARFIAQYDNAFFIGRSYGYPTAMEGALKLKEISYIHAEAYPAGELKHGPLALLTEHTPVIAVVNSDHTMEKTLGNVGEVLARQSPVIAVCQNRAEAVWNYTNRVITVPDVEVEGMPIVASVALQLLAYHAARIRGCEIDRPRNLAKSVTVE